MNKKDLSFEKELEFDEDIRFIKNLLKENGCETSIEIDIEFRKEAREGLKNHFTDNRMSLSDIKESFNNMDRVMLYCA